MASLGWLGGVILTGALASLAACGAEVVVSGGDGGTATAQGGHGTGQGAGGDDDGFNLGGFGGEGGVESVPWKHNCTITGIGVDMGGEPVAILNEVCPDDYWAAMHHDGAVAYDVAAGFVGHLDFHACASDGGEQIHFGANIDGSGSFTLTTGSYLDGAASYQLASGTLVIAADGDVGEMLMGSYTATFGPTGGGGEPIVLSGEVRACHLPVHALP